MNPGCNLPQCNITGNPAIFYGFQFVGDYTIHILYSSFDELTISIIQTKKGYGPSIDYSALFNKTYSDAISFGDDISPTNVFSLIIRRLIKFNDSSDSGHLNANDTTIESIWLNGLQTNFTHRDDIIQPSFQLPLETVRYF
jgi:hypothetical protein